MQKGIYLGIKDINKPIKPVKYNKSTTNNLFVIGKIGGGMSWSVKSNILNDDLSNKKS